MSVNRGSLELSCAEAFRVYFGSDTQEVTLARGTFLNDCVCALLCRAAAMDRRIGNLLLVLVVSVRGHGE